jgi:protein-tyrosine phosphatase
MTDKDVEEITVEEPTYIAAAQPDQIPVMWDGGLVYRVPGTFTWKVLTLSEQEVDASYFTTFEYVDAKNMDFYANIENFRARQYLQNTKYPEPDTKSVIENYFKPAPPRLDIPHNIGVPVPADKVKDAVVKFGLESDFSDAQSRMILDGSDMAYMPNLIPGNTYYFKVEAGEEVLTQGKFEVEGPVRMIYAPSINNIRDLGGWTVQDGRKVRYGLIYRGGEANGLHPSVADDRQTLIDLGVGAEIDLRKDNNYDSGNGQVGKCAFGFPKADYFFKEGGYDCKLEHLTDAASKARYKQWFPFIVNHIKEGKAVYYHCVWGADRTGLVSVLLEGLLGLSQEQMNLEYELTSLSFAGLRPKSGYADGDHQKLIEKIKTYDGETLRDKFDTYWTKEVGVSQELIDEFRSIMLVGESDEPDAIEDLNVQDKSEIKAVYSITGTALPLSALNQAGIYVVKYNNGASRKIVVK